MPEQPVDHADSFGFAVVAEQTDLARRPGELRGG